MSAADVAQARTGGDQAWPLTPRQRDCLLVLQRAVDATGVAPTQQQLADALGLRSKSNVCALLDHLEERGYVERLAARRARAIRIVKRVPAADAAE